MSDEDTTINTKALDKIINSLTNEKFIAHVGILAGKNARSDGLSNATIGAKHEFGTTKIRRRSFLRMPLFTRLEKELLKAGVTETDLDQIIKKEGFRNFTEKMGILGVRIVLQAFDSGGFGTWQALKPITLQIRARKNQGTQILVRANSHQLRDSITFDVKKVK